MDYYPDIRTWKESIGGLERVDEECFKDRNCKFKGLIELIPDNGGQSLLVPK